MALSLDELAALRCSRRDALRIGSMSAFCAMVALPSNTIAAAKQGSRPAFTSVPLSHADTVVVPTGYTANVLFAWGDPISKGPSFKPDASNSAAEQALQAGMHHDGMHFFSLPLGSDQADHGLLAINHEYLDQRLLYPDAMQTWNLDKLRKAQNAVGVSIVEVARRKGSWEVVRPSRYARRLTAQTPMIIGGPAAGSRLMKTAAEPTGTRVIGTHSNCANGSTPWGTYLTCEENVQSHFAMPSGKQTLRQKRFMLLNRSGYRWHEIEDRFDVDKHPNEFHRFGWVVEIDPFDPQSTPVKRTALGRCNHESAFHTLAKDGRVVIYTGDDARFEYIYKFVSRDPWNPRERSANRDLLDHGTLFVGKFNDDGSGEWRALVHGENGLTPDNGFADQAEVVIHAKEAGEQAGGTKMDRPEWIVIHPATGEVYASLTNNNQRGLPGKPARDAANPVDKNIHGQIVRWREDGGDAASNKFRWDLFVIAGDPGHPDASQRGNIRGDAFGCPDTLRFGPDGMLWIGTDTSTPGRDVYASLGNNALLAADTVSGEIRRFLTGPRGCEITGMTLTPDGRTAFLNIQHPGEFNENRDGPRISTWPAGTEGARPRSATIVITKDDGGMIGS